MKQISVVSIEPCLMFDFHCLRGIMLCQREELLSTYDEVRRVSGLRRDPAVSAEDPTHIHTS